MSTTTTDNRGVITEVFNTKVKFKIVPNYIATPFNNIIRLLYIDIEGNLVVFPSNSLIGVNGKSAYEIAVENGFVGTEADWLLSLQGTDGVDGVDGVDGITYTRHHDFVTDTSYNGKAPIGSLDSDSVWEIVKVVVAPNGTSVLTTAINVKWDDRYTTTYV